MTAPSYTTTLSTLDQAESNTEWVEFTGTSTNGYDYNIHGSPQGADADWPFIQNTYAVTQTCTSTKSGYGSLGYDNGSAIGGHGTDGAYLVWQLFVNPNFYSYANDGLQVVIGDAVGSFYAWTVGGVDVGTGIYLGWQNHAVNTSVSYDDNAGSFAGSNEEIVGAAVRTTTGVGKGEPHAVDVIRYGRCDAKFEYGETADYCTIAGYAAVNDAVNNRYGLIQEVAGGYLWKGLMQLGSASNAVDFRDSNRIIFVQWTPKVTANFNTIEVVNASSNIEMTGFQFIVLDTTTASAGRWITTNDATVALTSCVFNDMSTFVFDSNTTIDSCTFRRCGKVTQGAGTFTNCTFDESPATIALAADDLTLVTGCDFTSDGNGYAIEGFSTATSYTLTNLTFTGYASGDGSTGDEALHVLASSGTVTINYTGVAPSVHTAGATIVKVGTSVDVTVTVKTSAGVAIENARVLLRASDGTGDFPFEDVVGSISNSGTTATVIGHTAHGMASNDKVEIQGASEQANNGVYQITYISTSSYSYTMASSPSSPTGTITSTFVAVAGLTNASGIVTTSREYSADQPVVGWARKSTSSPYYKPGPVSGYVDTADGFSATAVLILDE